MSLLLVVGRQLLAARFPLPIDSDLDVTPKCIFLQAECGSSAMRRAQVSHALEQGHGGY